MIYTNKITSIAFIAVLIFLFYSCGNKIKISTDYQGNYRMTRHFSVGKEWPVKEDDGLIINENNFHIFKPPLSLGIIFPNKITESHKSLICEYITQDGDGKDVVEITEFFRDGEKIKINWSEGTYEFERKK